ncbi:phage tail tape measure protein [Phormidium tenue]|uniref:Phage tail tape measure protein n=2 Tax=Phormidium tenue TaxID=126344 RepID=A0ABR8CAE1_9CYAN|nr:phage tail tape measure protein [Phormidium tenue]MBD2316651.1 phage tail tape measure protein [Phormidium tenue FACHB-1050]
MAKDKTATIVFKGEDQISPAIKTATASVAGLNQSFAGVENASNKTAVQIKAELTKAIAAVNNELANLSKQKLTPDVQLKQNNALKQLADLKAKLNEVDKVVVKPQVDPESLLKSQLQAQALGQLVGKLNELKSASLEAFGEFRKAQRNAAAQATDITGLSAAVKTLGGELKNQVSATELLDNAARVAQKGYRDTADNINVLRATQKLAIATNTDFNTALEATTDILKAYNLPSKEADNVTAQLAATARVAGTSVGELAPQIGRIAVTASSAGVGINDLLGFLGNAAKQGADSRTSLTALNKVINDLSTGDLVRKGQEIGISFDEAAIKTGGLNALFKQLQSQGISTAEGLQRLGFNAKEAAAITPSLASGITQVKDAQAGLNKQFETQIDPKKSAENQLKDSLVDLGKTVAPIANQVVLATRSMIAAFTQLPAPIQQTLGVFIGLVGLSTSVALAFGAIGQAVGIASAIVPALVGSFTSLSGAIALANGVLTTEVTLTKVATVAKGAYATATATASAALGGFAASATAALIPLGALVAVIGAIAAAKFLSDKTVELKEYNAAVEENVATGQQLSNQTSGLISKIQSLQAVRAKGGAITDEQIRKEKGTLKLTEDQINAEKEKLAQIEAQKAPNAELEASRQVEIASRKKTIALAEKEKKELEDLIATGKTKATANVAIARSEKDVEVAVKSRIDAEKRANDNQAKLRSRDFESQSKNQSRDFERQSQTEKQAFEKSLNNEKRDFEASQKADKERFEKGLLAEQRTFNDDEKSKDATYQKSKQDAERAFNAEQQAQKAAFDKQQQDASRAFDAQQNKEKLAAESQFSQRRLEIERQLQLDAAKTPEDRAKLEAEFKIADEKAAREKAAFAQLKADEEAFALKQQQAKIAFEESQKLAAQTFEANQQAAKLAFDDALKLKDQEYETQKEAAKLAFEDTLKAKRDALEAGQNETKLAFEEQLALKKQEFEDAERVKKDAFELSQNEKKAAFEESERVKRQAFEDNLKALEAKFKADERAKDLANAQQVAAIKNATPASAIASKVPALAGIGVKPLATGGRFNAGEQLLVGERGAELVKFNNGGFVNNASDTKQILQSSGPASNMSTAKIEGLLLQLVGKLDRPNIAVTTAESPSDTLIKIQREIGRSLAVGL